MITRYQSDEIKNVLHISMYLDPRFKLLPMLTEEQKRTVQRATKIELINTILHEREKNQETEQTASQPEQLEDPQPKRTKLEKFLMLLLDQEQEKMLVLQKLPEQNYRNMNLRNHLV